VIDCSQYLVRDSLFDQKDLPNTVDKLKLFLYNEYIVKGVTYEKSLGCDIDCMGRSSVSC
jgi:hypothetical protein